MKADVTKRLAALEGPRDGMTRLILTEQNGSYVHRGSGRVYSRADVDRMGDAVLIITERVVRKAGEDGQG